MKNAFLIFISILLSSCLNSNVKTSEVYVKPKFNISVSSEKNTKFCSILCDVIWNLPEKDRFGKLQPGSYQGFDIQIANKTNQILKVLWDKSSIFYNNKSYSLFIEGQKYFEFNTPMSPSIIPGSVYFNKSIFSSDQVSYINSLNTSLGWEILPIDQYSNITIVLCIESGGVEDYFTISVSMES